MGFFDGPSASLFRQAPDGRVLFRPFGRRGGTYEVSPERAAHLRRWQQRYMLAMFAVIIVAVERWRYAALWLVPLLVLPLYLKYWHFARTLPRTDEEPLPVRRAELFAAIASATGSRVLLVAAAGSALLFAAGQVEALCHRCRTRRILRLEHFNSRVGGHDAAPGILHELFGVLRHGHQTQVAFARPA